MILRIAALGCAVLTLGFADTLYLRSGTTIQGSYAGGDTRNVRILVGSQIETYPIGDVLRLEFGAGPAAQMQAPPPPAPPPPRERYSNNDRPDRPADRNYGRPAERDRPAPDAYASGIEIPSGTNLVVRMIDNVDSERDSIGQTYRASIDEPVVVNGQTVIPRGADVMVKLIADTQSGKFSGRTALTLDIMQVMVNGRMVDVNTSEVTQASGSRTTGTAAKVGGGAAVGAILGGIFGGGKGAAIGAASGGALGAGAQVMTKGQKVKIPSETRLSFLLQQPLRA